MNSTGDAEGDAAAVPGGRLTRDDIARACAALGGTPAGWAPLTGGVSATIIRVDIDFGDDTRTRAVIRQPGAAAWKGTDRDTAARECALLGHLHAAGLAVPAPRSDPGARRSGRHDHRRAAPAVTSPTDQRPSASSSANGTGLATSSWS